MSALKSNIVAICVLLATINYTSSADLFLSKDNVENLVCPEDLKLLLKLNEIQEPENADESFDPLQNRGGWTGVSCFGAGTVGQKLRWLFNMQPDTSEKINTTFFFHSRRNKNPIILDDNFNNTSVEFNPNSKTIMIVHGFMSYSNASWIQDMIKAFLLRDDVNVIAVDWSGGGSTWKYWRAVANTRRVGSDLVNMLRRLIDITGTNAKNFYFVGHSLGAHISSFASHLLGGVSRITGLDPAQPCFQTADINERLDTTDADFVDIIHTNGRLLKQVGFGLPEPIGHADFYPNGGMKQPGCETNTLRSIISPLAPLDAIQEAICSHGRSYLLFTESLINNCKFKAHAWNLTGNVVNASILAKCENIELCSEMGINAVGKDGVQRATGTYYVLTTEKAPYCPLQDIQMESFISRAINNSNDVAAIIYRGSGMSVNTNWVNLFFCILLAALIQIIS